MSDPALIALDWGTSSFRAYLLAADGRVLAQKESDQGILNTRGASFEEVYEAELGPWIQAHGALPAIASGMIGSRQGWVEAPYAPCPAGWTDIVERLAGIRLRSGGTLRIVPGLSRQAEGEAPDVMRGEETQILGAAARLGRASGLFVTPGTHSKWALLKDGRIEWFATFMTGELFATLCRHTILGRLMEDGGYDAAAFRRGLALAAESRYLLHNLFSTRTLGLFGDVPPSGLRSYLSGLLIGQEIAEATALAGIGAAERTEVVVIGSASVVPPYAEALAGAGFPARIMGYEATIAGLLEIARAAGLMGDAE